MNAGSFSGQLVDNGSKPQKLRAGPKKNRNAEGENR